MTQRTSFLLTDLYQLAMMQAYYEAGETGTAVFEFFVRKLPAGRNFLMAAGLEQALEFLETLRVTGAELDWLRASGRFGDSLLAQLEGFRFTGDVHAMPEGTVFFPDEPILRITAPLPQAQYVETRLINILHFQSLIAAKAARQVLAAGGRRLVDFGLRRAHGAEAGLMAARAAYLAGYDGSANVEAERLFGVPAVGTMAHSFVQAFDDETAAFESFARARPDNLAFVIDTYDTEAAARKVVALAPRLKAQGIAIGAVRLDSGDLGALAVSVRRILDAGGLRDVAILASGGLDEQVIARLCAAGAPIDGFGVGTDLTTSGDAPALDCAYKLQEYAGRPRRKRSEGKATWPGRKQVWRGYDDAGRIAGDILSTEHDTQPGTPLIRPVMRAGKRLGPPPTMAEIRDHAAQELRRLPEALRGLDPALAYPVRVADALLGLAAEVDRFTGG
ncbi:nicotinate phosphoribosyltransferase [Actibacterium sp. MT2.3-13A]|uniref:nicotinate phosphoribosyltransferase n=1 Tax=Actibacterium sp. MT2.3-13A TaxID=2828332 RepID=UPI001BA87D91|nr:nicotinate phosphoribosyltransferase [Actibacterium sp. MT2.3-13A]